MKKIALFAMAAITFAACSNEDDVLNTAPDITYKLGENEIILVPEVPGGTRNTVTPGLVNEWVVGDVVGTSVVCENGTTIENGKFTAQTVTFHDRTLLGFTSDGTVDWQNGTDKHDFYIYYPYSATATHTAVPYTLNAIQTVGSSNQFMWSASKNLIRPADNAVPFAAKRYLPIAEFCINHDDATLDGYTLDNIVVKPSSGNMAYGSATFDLENMSDNPTFSGTTDKFQLNSSIAVNSIPLTYTKTLFMTIPPATAREYTVTATFSKGTDKKAITITRSDAYTITSGKGNVVQYTFSTSRAEATAESITGSVGDEVTINGVVWSRSNVVYLNHIWRFAESLDETYPDNPEEKQLKLGIVEGGTKRCYWQFGELRPSGPTTIWNGTSTALGDMNWGQSLDPCNYVAPGDYWRLPTVPELQALATWMRSNTHKVCVTRNGLKYYGRLKGSVDAEDRFTPGSTFFPYAGQIKWDAGWINYVGNAMKLWSWAWGPSATCAKDMWFNETTEGVSVDQAQRYGSTIRCVKR